MVELAAWGFGSHSPVNGSWKTGDHFHAKGWALPQGALAWVLGWRVDSPAQRPEQGTPRIPCSFKPCDTAQAVEVLHGAPSNKHPRFVADNTFALHYDFQMHEDAFVTKTQIHLKEVTKCILSGMYIFYQWLLKVYLLFY